MNNLYYKNFINGFLKAGFHWEGDTKRIWNLKYCFFTRGNIEVTMYLDYDTEVITEINVNNPIGEAKLVNTIVANKPDIDPCPILKTEDIINILLKYSNEKLETAFKTFELKQTLDELNQK